MSARFNDRGNEGRSSQQWGQRKERPRYAERLERMNMLLPRTAEVKTLLDLGCGDCTITEAVRQCYGVEDKHAHGADVYPADDYKGPASVVYHNVADDHIDLPDGSMDVITCFVSIHHFDNLDAMLREMCRLLSPKGYLFIREHDVKNDRIRDRVDAEHRKYEKIDNVGLPTSYTSREELRRMLTAPELGLFHVGDSLYGHSNPQGLYHSLFRKYVEVRPEFDAVQAHHAASSPEPPVNNTAVVLLLMGTDAKYVSGVLAAGWSVKKRLTEPRDLVLLVTPDVPEHILPRLRKVFRVISTPYWDCVNTVRWKSYSHLYDVWLMRVLTKTNVLALTEYEKVLFLDGDTVATGSLDPLFELNAPAGTLSVPFEKEGTIVQHGNLIEAADLDRSLNHTACYGICGSVMLLEPSAAAFNGLRDLSLQPGWRHPECNAGPDEELFARYYGGVGDGWTHISRAYNCQSWKQHEVQKATGDDIKLLHYVACKPWTDKYYPDFDPWYEAARELIAAFPEEDVNVKSSFYNAVPRRNHHYLKNKWG